MIKEIHRTLTAGTYDERRYIVNEERPGEFKRHDYVYKTEYYNALQEYDETKGLEGLYGFLLQQLIKTWEGSYKRLEVKRI